MLSKKVNAFLGKQKQFLLKLDESEGYSRYPEGRYPLRDRKTGRLVSVNEVLYNNQIAWLNSEEAQESLYKEFYLLERPGFLNEDTLSTNAPTFTTATLPLVRRIYNRLIAMDLVSTQPLSGPTGYIYWLNKVYSNTTAEVTAGQRTDNQTPSQYPLSSEQPATIRALQIEIKRKLIETINYKLQAKWTLEAAQDFQSQYKVDVESEVVAELGDEIIREIDRLVINALLNGVAHTITWNPNSGQTLPTEINAYRRELYNSIVDGRAWIHSNKNIRGNEVSFWLIMSPTTWARLAKVENYGIDGIIANQDTDVAHRYDGVINNIYKVYVNNEFDDDVILMGIKGDWKYSCGYYSPYIPLFTSEKFVINDDFSQRAQGAMSRFAYGVLPETSTGSTNNGLVKIEISSS